MHLLPVASWDRKDATGGVVTRSYVSNLREGRIENPGLAKLEAIAEAMGFPPRLGFGDEEGRVPDATLAVILEDETARELLGGVSGMWPADRRLMLGIERQIGSPES